MTTQTGQTERTSRRRGRGEGSYRKRPDGRWEARLSVPSPTGARRRVAFYAPTKAALLAKVRQAQHDLAHGLPLASERLTLEAFLRRYLAEEARPRLRDTTFDSYRMICEQHLIPSLGQMRLVRLQPDAVTAYMNAKHEAGLSAATVRNHHAVLRRALTIATRWGLVQRNVASLAPPPPVEREEVRPLDDRQARALLAAVRHDPLGPLVTLALVTGARQGELLALRWDRVDLDARTVRIDATLQRRGGDWHLQPPKTQRSRRTISIPAEAVEVLRQHRIHQHEQRLAAGPGWVGDQHGGLVFTDGAGQPLAPWSVTRRVQTILAQAGLPRQRFHDLRHAAATMMLTNGVPLRVAMERLGHSQISVTANIYSHVLPEVEREAAERVGSALWGSA